jgi:hypothetical protein
MTLRDELTTDPLGRGYANMTSAQIEVSLRTKNRTRLMPIRSTELVAWAAAASSGELPRIVKLENCVAAGFSATNPLYSVARIAVSYLLARDGTALDLNLPDRVQMVDGLIAGGVLSAADKAALVTLATESINRIEELSLGDPHLGDIQVSRQ